MSETVTITGADGAHHFYTLDRVLQGLIQTLAAGRVEEAASLYAQVREDIAFQLIGKTQGNDDVFRQVANLFFRARDYERAAYCCEHLDETDKAAELYEKAGNHAAAAQMFAASGAVPKAAEMFEKAGSPLEAARLYQRLDGEDAQVRAAVCFERANRVFDAAQCYEKAGRLEKAMGLYAAIDDDSPDKKQADRLLKGLEEKAPLERARTGMMQAVDGGAIDIGGGAVTDARERITMMEGFEALSSMNLFAELTLTELKAIYHLCTVVDAPFGARLVQAGHPSEALWVLLGATVDVRGQGGRDVARLEPGAHVGEMGLFDDQAAGVDVIVAAPGRILRLDKKGFRDAMAADDTLAIRIYRVLFTTLRDRLRHTTDQLLDGGVST